MADHPILFSAPMVRAILDGTKTQTRRVVKPQPPESYVNPIHRKGWWMWHEWHPERRGSDFSTAPLAGDRRCPYSSPGGLLWVREAWRVHEIWDAHPPRDVASNADVWYEASGTPPVGYGRSRRSFHMPKWATRIWLRVTDVRVERIREISGVDAVAEGCCSGLADFELAHYGGYAKARREFRDLWDSINAGRGYAWGTNPWVWVVSFERAEAPSA